jgi:hypothetical protein
VRVLLDAHVSGRVIGRGLRERGHDVRAAAEERRLERWADSALLELAARERRVMITFDAHDFARLAGEWAAGGRHHAGLLLIAGIDHSEFGRVLRVIDATFAARPDQDAWRDHTAWGTRSGA